MSAVEIENKSWWVERFIQEKLTSFFRNGEIDSLDLFYSMEKFRKEVPGVEFDSYDIFHVYTHLPYAKTDYALMLVDPIIEILEREINMETDPQICITKQLRLARLISIQGDYRQIHKFLKGNKRVN